MEQNRRKFLTNLVKGSACAATIAAPVLTVPAQAARFSLPRKGAYEISFVNQHTGEKFSGEYRVGDRYLPDAFDEINFVLRDFRANEVFPIDPRAIDILYAIRQKAETNAAFEILSGYRCPKTNAMLRRVGSGVAKNSLHMVGQAIDLRLPGHSTRGVRNIARSLRAGGVGYYPKSNFVHVDTGQVRSW